MEEILLSLSRVKPADDEMDSVRESHKYERRRAFDVLMEAQAHWSNMDRFRRTRERNKRYTYGDQWSDQITVDCETMTEEEYIKSQGSVPLTNNLIRRLVRNVIGVYRMQSMEPICVARDRDEQKQGETMTTILQYNMQLNRRKELDARTLEEFLISSFIVHRKWYGWNSEKNRLDCWTTYVQPNNFFIDANMRDFRGWDCSCVGEVHDISFEALCGQFAKSPADYQKLKHIYASARNLRRLGDTFEEFGYSRPKNYDFICTSDPTRCRVIEVWRKESKPRYRCHDYNNGDVFKVDIEDYDVLVADVNASRLKRGVAAGMKVEDIPLIQAEWFMDDYWYYYFLTPFGDILDEGETPYAHKSHPYVFKAYPFIDGEIHSFVSDVIDQQRYTNRLVTLYDWIMRASAKGVLLVPEDAVGKMSMDEIADEWSRFNGVIAYKAKPGVPIPQQVSANSTNIGIAELLNIQLKFFEDISGVHGALQGRQGQSGTSGTLYAQQAQNATTSLLDILDSFSMFIVDGAYKDVKNIQQFYDEKKTFNIAGKTASIEYDPKKIRDVEFDLSITESTNTPAYRQMANDFLIQIWSTGQISLEQLLEVGQFPFGDELLQSVRSQKEQMERGEMPQAISPELQQQVAAAADQEAVNRGYNMLRR
jgi:hypothetical protein